MLMRPHTARTCLSLSMLLTSSVMMGQAKAQPCFFGTGFESGEIPAGWDIGPLVERQTPAGDGLGELVPAWSVGTAAQANAGGFFPVPDMPIAGSFAMANDDAAPCNCAMIDVTLTTPSIDLSDRNGVAMECRVFNPQTLGAGAAVVEASLNGGSWISLATIPAATNAWQDLFVNLSAFDGLSDIRLRFRWSDGGTWASGFAVDDICLRERYSVDFSVLRVFPNDISASPFTLGDQSMFYRQRPLEQAGPLSVTAEVMNSGTTALPNVQLSASLFFNGNDLGPFPAEEEISLVPGERRSVVIPTGWIPDSPGELDIFVQGGPVQGMDQDVNDNSGLYIQYITGPGWDHGYGAMACDDGVPQGVVGGDGSFIAANRMELLNPGSTPKGISTVLGGNSLEGEVVRAILMDANLAFVDTTTRHTLNANDVENAGLGLPLYLPFDQPMELPPGDYFVGLQHLAGQGPVYVSTSGNQPAGASVLMAGVNFDAEYIQVAPMVRLHFTDFGVGMTEQAMGLVPMLHAFPVPMRDQGTVLFTLEGNSHVHSMLLDAMGRVVQEQGHGQLAAGTHRLPLEVGTLPTGMYLLQLTGADWRTTARIVVE